MKWQEASGTAEQKVPFDVMCLADALQEGSYGKAYLVLGGPGWTLRDWYVSGASQKRLVERTTCWLPRSRRLLRKLTQGQL